MSSKGEMHSKCDNIETMIKDQAEEIIEKRFQSSLSRFRIGLETTMKGSNFFF